jgi:hypothetical protein
MNWGMEAETIWQLISYQTRFFKSVRYSCL